MILVSKQSEVANRGLRSLRNPGLPAVMEATSDSARCLTVGISGLILFYPTAIVCMLLIYLNSAVLQNFLQHLLRLFHGLATNTPVTRGIAVTKSSR